MKHDNWRDIGIGLAIVLLPWQARLIFLYREIDGQPYEYGTLSVYAVMLVILFALFLLHKKLSLPKSAYIPASVLIGWIFISTAFSKDPILALWFAFSSIFAFAYFFIIRNWERKKILISLTLMGVLQGVLGWVQLIQQQVRASSLLGVANHVPETLGESVVIIYGDRFLRAYGMLMHPNVLGGVLAISLLAALYLFASKTYNNTKRSWIILMGSILFLLSSLLITFSRSALLAVGAAGIFWAVYWIKRGSGERLFRFAQVVSAGIALFFAFNIVADSIWLQRFGLAHSSVQTVTQESLDERSTDERIVSLYGSQSLLNEKNVAVGVGPGNYVAALAHEFPELPIYSYQPIHNAFVLIIFEIGVLGLAFLMWLHRRLLEPVRKKHAQALQFLPLLIALFVTGLVDHYLWSSFVGQSMWWLAFGMIQSHE